MRDFTKQLSKDFLQKLNITDENKVIIHDAVAEVKKTLQEEISKAWNISPRFMTQGSARYRTQNNPCYKEYQQVDHDIGCYLPLSIHQEEEKPKKAATEFFELVDGILRKLVREKEWKTFSDEKDTCSRVIVNDLIHIDIPLYSVPDNEFGSIKESKSLESCSFKSFSPMCCDSTPEETWDDFDFTKVMLAHRKNGWKVSDPRKLNTYFEKTFAVKGEQVRRVCRYIKAFRDFKWEMKGPSSIYLMCIVDSIMKSENINGDDIALLDVLKEITNLQTRSIINPSDHDEIISTTDKDFDKLKIFAKSFFSDLERAIKDETISNEAACELIRKHLGNRFPIDEHVDFDKDRYRKMINSIEPSHIPYEPPVRTRAG